MDSMVRDAAWARAHMRQRIESGDYWMLVPLDHSTLKMVARIGLEHYKITGLGDGSGDFEMLIFPLAQILPEHVAAEEGAMPVPLFFGLKSCLSPQQLADEINAHSNQRSRQAKASELSVQDIIFLGVEGGMTVDEIFAISCRMGAWIYGENMDDVPLITEIAKLTHPLYTKQHRN